MAKKDPDGLVTNETLDDAVDTILKGMDNMLEAQKRVFATKDDLKQFATKEDLKREVSYLRDDINGLSGELAVKVSRKEFNQLNSKVDRSLAS